MNFLSKNHFYVNNMCAKFQGKKSHTKKDIQNLPTYVAVRNHFTSTNFDTLPRTKFFFFSHEFFGINLDHIYVYYMLKNFKSTRYTKEKIFKSTNMCSCKGQFHYYQLRYIYW